MGANLPRDVLALAGDRHDPHLFVGQAAVQLPR